MNYMQHNKNAVPTNGPIIAKDLSGKTSSQVALNSQSGKRPNAANTNIFTQGGPNQKGKQGLGQTYNNNEFAPTNPQNRGNVIAPPDKNA